MKYTFDDDLSEVREFAFNLDKEIKTNGVLVNYENTVGNCMIITFDIEGDWKHDHLYFNSIVRDFFDNNDEYKLIRIEEEEVGESDEDSYESYHRIYVCHAEDANTLEGMSELFEVAYTKDEDVPTQTGIAYKVFRVKSGKLYPPMVSNIGGTDTPVGVWLDAEEGEFGGLSKTGRPQVKSSQGGTLAYRPGYHLGDVPRAPQFDRLNKETGEYEFPKDFVWGECEYAMDIDYQDEADEQGYMRTKDDGTSYRSDKYQHSLAGLKKLPKGGYYKYRTNPRPDTVPWVITGQIKVNRLLDDFEVNDILEKKGIEPIHRQGGDKTLAELGLSGRLSESKSAGRNKVRYRDDICYASNESIVKECTKMKFHNSKNDNKITEMTDTELDDAKKKLNADIRKRTGKENLIGVQMTDDEKKHSTELDCISMINSILAYGDFASAQDVIDYEKGSYHNYLERYINALGEDRVKELIQGQMDDIERIDKNTYEDSEGLAYNSIRWKKKAEAVELTEEEAFTAKERAKFIRLMVDGLMKMGYNKEEANDIAIKRADAEGADWRVRHGGDIEAEVRQQLRMTATKEEFDSEVVPLRDDDYPMNSYYEGCGRKPKKEATHRTDADEYSANEIVLYAENDRDIYFKHIVPVIDNLAKKMAKGVFDEELAKKAFIYPVEAAVKQYKQEFDADVIREYGFDFGVATRELSAAQMLSEYMGDIKNKASEISKKTK